MIYCKDCIAWQDINEQHGKCHGKIPNATLVPTQGIGGQGMAVVTFWPETRPDDGCMEGEPGNFPVDRQQTSALAS
jgi:hypothetical protein